MDLLEQLQGALGAGFPIERELGGGGMSRVFLAEDRALRRRVVVKVLAPALAEAMSLERFRREIQIVAGLQHPNIVPVIASGEVAGLPYFTMPYLPGESLADRLASGPRPTWRESVETLRGVAQALVVAHERGIVHRDVKPANILLADGQAVVSDFGIAKAIASAWAGPGDGLRTGTGMGVGTAKYAAPEQAIGDASADHRADIYSFGVVAYELLAGAPPFQGDTPVQLVTAHLTKEPRALDEIRRGLPPALVALVARCLEKSPEKRPASARELVDTIAALPSHEPSDAAGQDRVAPSPRRRLAWVAAAVGTAGVAVSIFAAVGAPDAADRLGVRDDGRTARIVVAAPSTAGVDTLLGIAFGAIVSSELEQSTKVRLVPPAEVRQRLTQMRLEPAARVTAAIAREVALRGGAAGVVDGSIARAGGSLLLTLRLVTADSARELVALHETVKDERDLSRAMTRLARRLRLDLGEARSRLRNLAPIGGMTTSSLEALAIAVAGIRANVVEDDQPKARRLLEEAVRLDPEFASAWRALAAVYNNLGLRGPDHALAAGRRAMALAHDLPPRERASIEAFYYYGVARDPERGEAAYRSLVELTDTTDGEANLADYMLRTGRPLEALALVTAALRHRDTSELLLRHLFRAQLESGRLAAADTALGLIRRLVPNTNRPFLTTVALAHHRGDHERVRAVIDSVEGLGRPVDRVAVAQARVTQAMLEGAPERAVQAWSRARALRADTGRMARVRDSIFDIWADALVLRDSASVRARLLRAVPWLRSGEAVPSDWPWAVTLDALVDAGLTAEARRARQAWERAITDTMSARLARRQWAFADVNIERVAAPTKETIARLRDPRFNPDHAEVRAINLATAFDRMGVLDSAAYYLAEFVRTPSALRFDPGFDGLYYSRALERLTELNEALGRDSLAVAYGTRLLALWRHAEPSLQPRVRAVQERLARLARRSPDAARTRSVPR